MVFPFGEGGGAWAECGCWTDKITWHKCDAHRKKDDMPLDIDKLRLTKSEYYDVIRKVYIYATPSYPKEVIDAQLAKALWGVVKWIEIDLNLLAATSDMYSAGDVSYRLEGMLTEAGIPDPEVMKEA